MNPLILDVETTSVNPFDPSSKLLFTGLFDGNSVDISTIEFGTAPYGRELERLGSSLLGCDIVVGFNLKFDLHWCSRYGVDVSDKKVLCLQNAEYILSGQTLKMPSLDECLTRRGLPTKLDFDFAISHSEQEWRDYLEQDLKTEYLLMQQVLKDLEKQPNLKRLAYDCSQDILTTQQMEFNGIKYDLQKSEQIAERLANEVREIDCRLADVVQFPWINWASGDHLSAVLFGGIAKYPERESYERTLKNGEIRRKEHWVTKEHVFPRLCEPLEKVKKEGYFKTDEGTLHKIKAPEPAKTIIKLILERAKLEKKIGTYYGGIPKLYLTNNWENGIIHGQLHHCVTKTGRLSSSGPNLQNIEDGVRECLISRFERG